MDHYPNNDQKRLYQWVTSLAITVVCCAVFFLFFAPYVLESKEEVIRAQVRIEMLEARLNTLENNILISAARHVAPQPAPQVSAPVPAAPAGSDEAVSPSLAPAGLLLDTQTPAAVDSEPVKAPAITPPTVPTHATTGKEGAK